MKPVAQKPPMALAGAMTRVLHATAKPKQRYSKHVYRLVKQVQLDATESQRALDCLNGGDLGRDRLCDIASEAARLSFYNMRHTITSREVHHALQAVAKGV